MTESLLYLECRSGISGDMTVAALLDLGADENKLRRALESLPVQGYSWTVSRVRPHGLAACDFDVRPDSDPHGHASHDHGREPSREHRHHAHEHRRLNDIFRIIEQGDLTPRARETARKIFTLVAEAEAKAHGIPVEEVHFHEVGAIDSIVDIVAAAVCLDDLDIREAVVSELSEGSGFVECQHGLLPVPVPAVVNIVSSAGLTLRPSDTAGEMVTPTGAAIAAALKTRDKLPPAFRILKTGIGAGKRDFGRPNVLRALLIEPAAAEKTDSAVWLLETNIDDATGEQLGLAMEKIFEAGALDVHYLPAFMKKNRPGWVLRVMAADERLERVEEAVFKSTTTIGLRRSRLDRTCLERESLRVCLPFGTADVKKCSFGDSVFFAPEYESVKRLAAGTGMDFKTVFDAVKQAAEEK